METYKFFTENYQSIIIFLAIFGVIALASKDFGYLFKQLKLPLISGYLFTGIIVGPFMLEIITEEAVHKLHFIDDFSLAFIAFAAGSELYLKELKDSLKSIAWVSTGVVITTFIMGGTAIFLMADFIPFMSIMSTKEHVVVAILAGTILVARSPSSAIAVINELRAKGPLTHTALGVTVVTDVVVIVLFSMSSSVAMTILTGHSFDVGFVVLILVEFLISLILGYILAKFLQFVLGYFVKYRYKMVIILLAGYSIFVLADEIGHLSHEFLPFKIHLEPLLICMTASFITTNFSRYRQDFSKVLHHGALPVFVAFFTLTGASLELDVFLQIWQIALAIFFVRLIAIAVGSFSGGVLAGDPMSHNKISWMCLLTQAGVGLGLARSVADDFPSLGSAFATMIIAVIVLNEMVGPLFFKWAINMVGESHTRAKGEPEKNRNVLIFGLDSHFYALFLARQLGKHGWNANIASLRAKDMIGIEELDVNVQPISDLSLDTMYKVKADQAGTIVALFASDDKCRQVCELAYEHFGTDTLIARLNNRANVDRFYELGVLVIEPTTAIVSLLEHFVRSPSAASLILGTEENQDIVDVEVRDATLHGIPLRDLRLPLDTLILSVHRGRETLISHGYTRLEIGDRVTIVGSEESLEEIRLRFEE